MQCGLGQSYAKPHHNCRMPSFFERAYGCLLGVAIGDAMGMPTSFLTPEQIRRRYGLVRGFVDPFPDHPFHAHLKAAQITDDTGQTLAVARAILRGTDSLAEAVAQELLRWAEEQGGLDAPGIGPSTRKALRAIASGIPLEVAGAEGDTNGAAMRISPVAIALGDQRRASDHLVDMVFQVCLPTHGTGLAVSAASAVAAAVNACLAGVRDMEEIGEVAWQAAMAGRLRGRSVVGPSVARRIRLAQSLVADWQGAPERGAMEIYEIIGAGLSAAEAVPAAFGVFMIARGDPASAILLAANMGGDCDTVASIAGALAGAYAGPNAFPACWVETVEQVNALDLRGVAKQLCNFAMSFRVENNAGCGPVPQAEDTEDSTEE